MHNRNFLDSISWRDIGTVRPYFNDVIATVREGDGLRYVYEGEPVTTAGRRWFTTDRANISFKADIGPEIEYAFKTLAGETALGNIQDVKKEMSAPSDEDIGEFMKEML